MERFISSTQDGMNLSELIKKINEVYTEVLQVSVGTVVGNETVSRKRLIKWYYSSNYISKLIEDDESFLAETDQRYDSETAAWVREKYIGRLDEVKHNVNQRVGQILFEDVTPPKLNVNQRVGQELFKDTTPPKFDKSVHEYRYGIWEGIGLRLKLLEWGWPEELLLSNERASRYDYQLPPEHDEEGFFNRIYNLRLNSGIVDQHNLSRYEIWCWYKTRPHGWKGRGLYDEF